MSTYINSHLFNLKDIHNNKAVQGKERNQRTKEVDELLRALTAPTKDKVQFLAPMAGSFQLPMISDPPDPAMCAYTHIGI